MLKNYSAFYNSVIFSNMTARKKGSAATSMSVENTAISSVLSANATNGSTALEKVSSVSKTLLLLCFCVTILGSQILLIYNVSTWMQQCNQELVVLSASLTSGLASIESRLKIQVSMSTSGKHLCAVYTPLFPTFI